MLEPTADTTPRADTTTATPAGWSTPDYTVVDTAMEVTAYSLNAL
ncbi:pyrroloquinoline quinone precursor peptide PqqA [uncultured Streptomyces sp.]|nr:pyrroloquinoline quinone precursor peptide PqqA [uncultured Streptomyces sp.]